MKVTQIGKYYPPYKGGIESHLYSISGYLRQWVEKLHVVVFNDGLFSKVEKNENLTITRCGKLFELFSTPFSLRMPMEICRAKSDIIHIHAPNPSAHLYYNLSCGSRKDHKLVITHHSDIIKQKFVYKMYKKSLRDLYERADAIIAATENHVKYSDILPEFQDKVRIIPYGIEIEDFRPDDEIKNRLEKVQEFLSHKKIILFIGRLVYYKGVTYLIDAFKKMRRDDAALVIIGKGPYFSTLKAQAMNMDNIVFIPETDNTQLKVFLNAAHTFVLPSIEKSEAFGIVQLEAMACGKPVISTNLCSGVKAVNINEKTGYIIEPKDPEALAEKLTVLLDDEDKYNGMRKAAIAHVRENYSSEKSAEKIYELYKELLK
ncbi:MAG: glycosyltransferase [Candidatus Muiribacteriaceae bacterium]